MPHSIRRRPIVVSRAPPILKFDAAGNLIQSWGGPKSGYEWPDTEHGIFVDYKDNVWISGNGAKDTNILKFTKNGKFLLQIGHHGKSAGSNDTENLNRPAGIAVYPKTNEVFVADGYGNRRVIVYDADTGAYKRHWGAYGKKPDDTASNARTFEGPGPPQFNTVHAIQISNDGLVYVGDRRNNRIQVFRPDGTFVKGKLCGTENDSGGRHHFWIRLLSGTNGSSFCTCRTGATRRCKSSIARRLMFSASSADMEGEARDSFSMSTASPRIPKATSIWANPSGSE